MTVLIFLVIILINRADHPSNIKKFGACIYFKNSLSLKVLDYQLLQECIHFEIKVTDKTCNFIYLYRSPVNPNMNFNPLQITSSLISTHLISETNT